MAKNKGPRKKAKPVAARAMSARRRTASKRQPPRPTPETSRNKRPGGLNMRVATLSEAFLATSAEREKFGIPADDNTPMPVVVEVNLYYERGLEEAKKRFLKLFKSRFPKRPDPLLVADTYYRCRITVREVRQLIAADQEVDDVRQRSIYRVWPDFKIRVLIDRSVSTIKADAARRSYDASGSDVVWAVVDSGVNDRHPHFQQFENLRGEAATLHRDFTVDGKPAVKSALVDGLGHGTHVAGVIAGGLSTSPVRRVPRYVPCVGRRVSAVMNPDSDTRDESERIEKRTIAHPDLLTGVAPRCKLVSLKVIDDQGESRSTDVIRALEYIRKEVNGHGKPPLRIHGVNLSVGYEFIAKWFACGQSPICVEVDRLVRSGVVVVVAAGNTGYGVLQSKDGETSTGMSLTINDPGNADRAITVGSTHRDSPYTYGVSYFSSKGPTGDGRLKPDLVAPGERITSCAAGANLQDLRDAWGQWPRNAAPYIDDSGTSMAAPHVSGAIAAFLSIRREFIGQPEEVKRIFLQHATSLGRERYFEGRGLVDLMRAISAV